MLLDMVAERGRKISRHGWMVGNPQKMSEQVCGRESRRESTGSLMFHRWCGLESDA